MLPDQNAVIQTLLGTLFTWGLTAIGSGFCLLHHTSIPDRLLLDGSLGFSAGVMIAASYWSLLAPALDLSDSMGYGSLSFIPVAIGFLFGALFVHLADEYFPMTAWVGDPEDTSLSNHKKFDRDDDTHLLIGETSDNQVTKRRGVNSPSYSINTPNAEHGVDVHKVLLMCLAITVHNIPEGLAVGVGFGAIGRAKAASFESARNLAIGIGIQNFPEGLAVSLPLKAAGFSTWRSIWYGQLSGIVEPIAAVAGCLAVQLVEPILPYALAFAAGAMIFVVCDDILPEAQSRGNGKLASAMLIVGFIVMMSLDVGLG